MLAGFGNIQGNVELWDVNHRKLINKMDAPDTTLLAWSPDGEHFITATTSPRLRIGNGFKIWHYSGTLLYERPWNKQEELWEVLWQTFPKGALKEPHVSYKPVEGILPSQPQEMCVVIPDCKWAHLREETWRVGLVSRQEGRFGVVDRAGQEVRRVTAVDWGSKGGPASYRGGLG
uniref:Translation initiation factor beta propellor-like domain-containing protein n=1 Tax=Timema genevievae TaxID=629358 RepID=A0A7R9K9G8_TIMGE|nr:unnamed protein product [Timema genevievae]